MEDRINIDFAGNTLNVGDRVIFSLGGSERLLSANIVRFTQKMVEIVYLADWHYGKRNVPINKRVYADQLIKLPA
jgi:hypothetical protein